MSHSQTASHGNDKPEADAKAAAKPHDKARDKDLLLALLVTDWLHGDRHFAAKLRELVLPVLKDLGADGLEAKGRLEGMPSGVRAAQDQPAQRIDEARQPASTKAS